MMPPSQIAILFACGFLSSISCLSVNGEELSPNDWEWQQPGLRDSSVDLAGNLYTLDYDRNNIEGENSVSKYTNNGTLLWRRYLGELSGALKIATNARGEIFVGGNASDAHSDLGGPDIYIAKFDNVLRHQWTKFLGSAGDDFLEAITSDQLGNVYFGGIISAGRRLDRDGAFGKLRSDGRIEWIKQLTGEDSAAIVRGIGVRSDSTVLITGRTAYSPAGENLGGLKGFVAQYSPQGDLEWFSSSSGPTYICLDIDRSGNVIVGGSGIRDSRSQPVLSKYNQSGNELWTSWLTDQIPEINMSGFVNEVKSDSGDSILTLTSQNSSNTFILSKHSGNGTLTSKSQVDTIHEK